MRRADKFFAGVVAAAALMFVAGQVFAANLVSNPGFDTGDLTGWSAGGVASGATITVIPTGGNPGDYAWLNNTLEPSNLYLYQATAAGSAVGAGLTVSYSFDLLGGNQAAGGVDYIHIEDENASGGVIGQTILGPYFPSASGWTPYSGTYTTVANSDHMYVEFDASTGANAGSTDQMGVDNVVLSVVPEPTTLTLVALGMVGAVLGLRKRRA
ncbi:MAG TPA: PEP-CTERM sorting domain-containing protein [Verrucomicrobiae bacterium]|nr:PEP-CTERM sorting domain-containing protein [Verrucomicrobiae bacterium]